MSTEPVNLNAIHRREQEATPAPWFVGIADGCRVVEHGDQEIAALTSPNPQADAEFIAHARQDVPLLLTRIEHLRSELDKKDARIAELENMLAHANGDAGRNAFNTAMDYLR